MEPIINQQLTRGQRRGGTKAERGRVFFTKTN
jgi:hypothetical protein